MKKQIIALSILISLSSCSKDEINSDSNNQANLVKTTNSSEYNFNEIPNPAFDQSNKGLYQGTLVSEDMSFHEKITINVGNNGQYYAFINTTNGETHTLKGQPSLTNTAYNFKGKIGHFKMSITSDGQTSFSDVMLKNMSSKITVFKDTSSQRMMPSIGTFTNTNGNITGTWDFTFTPINELGFSISVLTINVNGGSTYVLNISGNYQRLCSAPGTAVPIGIVNSSYFNIQSVANILLGNHPLNYSFVANRIEAVNVGCLDAPTQQLGIAINNWTWNGFSGTALVDTNSLPTFEGL